MNDKTLAMLRCPKDRSQVSVADPALVARLNAAIAAGRIRNLAGERVQRAIDGGLLREAGDLLYPIVDQIPIMLYDDAIALDQLNGI
jgi:uncharacterized protein YbaR (Trm112 family)